MKHIEIYDTTLRDGTQGVGFVLSVQDKINILKILDEIGFDYIEGGFPLSNPKEVNFFRKASSIKLNKSKLSSFGMTRKKGIKPDNDVGLRALLDANTPVVTIVGKTWVFHIREIIGTSKDENLSMIKDSINFLFKKGKEVIYDAEHFFDGYKEDPKYSIKTLQVALNAGASKVILCDTNGGTLFNEIGDICKDVKKNISPLSFGIHSHNDCGLAIANSLEAVRNGATQVQGTINGVGERCGNVDLISVIANLGLKMNYKVIDGNNTMNRLVELSQFVDLISSREPNLSQSFVGRNAFSHKGGMHSHAVLKNVSSYEHISPSSVGNRRRIIVGELSGVSGVSDHISKKLKLDNISQERKRNILNEISNLEFQGYSFEDGEASLEILIRKILNENVQLFELVSFNLLSKIVDNKNESLSKIEIKILNENFFGSSTSNDFFTAIENSLKMALIENYPYLDEVITFNRRYKWINNNDSSNKIFRVNTDFKDDEDNRWSTVAIGNSIDEAYLKSISDGYSYAILNKNN